MTVPACPALRTAHAYDFGPAHRQTGSREQEASTRHSRSRHRGEQTDGQTQMDKRADGSGPLCLRRLLKRCRRDTAKKEKNKTKTQKKIKKTKLIDKKKKKLQIRICTKIWKLFCFFRSLNHAHRHQNEKYEKSVDLCY